MDSNGEARISSINAGGKVTGSLTISLTSFKSPDTAMIYCIKDIAVSRRRAAMLAVEREGCSHLISMTARGRLMLLASLPNVIDRNKDPNDDKQKYKVVFAVSEFSKYGDVLLGGFGWLKKISIKMN